MEGNNPNGVRSIQSATDHGQMPKLRADLAKAQAKITSLEQTNKELRQRVIDLERVDQLTGLYNRKRFFEKLNQEFLRAGRYHHPLAIAVVDPDHLKHINDEYGQEKGDQVMKAIANVVADVARDGDSYARISGQVFAVILPHASMQNCYAFAERLRKRIIALVNHAEYSTIVPCPLTASIGGASTEAGIGSQEMLLQQAENMAILSKTNGGNTSSVFEYSEGASSN